ncbi:MAG: GGDEF domain-containing protein, partial [Gammaproteobacteria bacterium]
MDDFGTGYSSLHQIRTLPLNKLKIDRSFIMELPDNQEDVILAKMIISMGKNLSLKVVAEGVETEEQQQFLMDEGCDLLQGFLLGKPMPAIELQQLFSKLA